MSYTPINKGQTILEPAEREAEFERRRGYGVEEAYQENRRQWAEFPKQKHIADYPLHVDVELASVCNLKCPMCYTITDHFKEQVNAKLMDYDLFTKIVDECAEGGVYSIRLSLRGESFLHKRVLDCIDYAKKKGIKEVSSLTNAHKMDEKQFTEIMNMGMDWITISVDGMADVYEKIRKPAKFDRLLEKLANFKKIKEEADKIKPVIKIQTIYPAIMEDPDVFYNTFAPLCDEVASNPLIDYLRLDDDDQILYHEDFSCPQLYQRLTIGADGNVMLCANDEIEEFVIGNAQFQTIHEIWHGPRIQEARELHKNHRGHLEIEPCRKCYLPRRTEPETLIIGGEEVILEQYINRTQKIGL
ncbi:MAG: SPASM domain-containing protein [Methylocystaceae bacterium]|nr:SPASM domain-containing protein [Methylocystaceae bacterium]